MLLIGLTGSIATGKSTVSRILASEPHSLPIIDADHLAHAVILPGTPAYRAILSHFGSTTPNLLYDAAEDPTPSPHGASINRRVLGQRVFGPTEQNQRDIKVLNGIVHPAVRRAMLREVVRCWLRGHWAAVLDVPLLFEGRLDVFCGVTLLIGTSPAVQLERLLLRDAHLTREDAERRIASQMSVLKKRELADVVVWNDGSKEDLEKEIARFVADARRGRGWFWTAVMATCWPVTATVIFWRLVGNWLKRRKRDELLKKDT
ncbi:Dephospho-CoA kinase CAB5 [Drechslerella dactyloides]|uniref:Dephospho-CoA kinase CAB5 n=1 Tax=Drechslerella dactyloides TaxID=74499 RepID=A0AAD6IZZ8_DREDA|nr:Dephospho-CoA kinase CAB5 [Drechslerella dactyloides]